MTQPIKFYIHSRDDLNLLLACHKYRLFRYHGKVILHLNIMSPAESAFWQRQLNRIYFDRADKTLIYYAVVAALIGFLLITLTDIVGSGRHLVPAITISILWGMGGGIVFDYVKSKHRHRLLKTSLLKRIAYLESNPCLNLSCCPVS